MSKELTPLEALENIKHYDSRVELHKNDYEIIEYAFNQLETCKKCNEVLAKQVEENEINVKTLEILKEFIRKMDEKEKNEIEMKIYSRMCGSCPNAKMCHEECETCEEYDEVLACALGEDYDN